MTKHGAPAPGNGEGEGEGERLRIDKAATPEDDDGEAVQRENKKRACREAGESVSPAALMITHTHTQTQQCCNRMQHKQT